MQSQKKKRCVTVQTTAKAPFLGTKSMRYLRCYCIVYTGVGIEATACADADDTIQYEK